MERGGPALGGRPGGGYVEDVTAADAPRYVFGPVPSRRLGRSLGVDPVPFKTCNWNCAYCQLGRSSPLAVERRAWVPTDEVVAEVRAALADRGDEIDWVTFVGSGEPTLHAELGRMIAEVKAMGPTPVAVVTNGTLLGDPDVQRDLAAADAVLPTVLAGSERLHLRVHRPARGHGYDRFVEGLLSFREVYRGRLWAEVLLMAGVNDDDEALRDLAALLSRVRPDAIHVILPTRPPNEDWIDVPAPERVAAAVRALAAVAPVVAPDAAAEAPRVVPEGDLGEVALGIVTRHPMSVAELARLTDRPEPAVRAALEALEARFAARRVIRGGEEFWAAAGARFVHRAGAPAKR